MNRNGKKFTFIDLFAGIGGFRIALESFGLTSVYSNEWDKHAQITYRENFGDTPDSDITKVNEKMIPKHNVLCAGFPCQAFSISGKQQGFKDTRGALFFDIARIVKHHMPEVLFLENVKNFARHDNGRTLDVVVKTLDEMGYNVFHQVLNASFYGCPTARQRIYFVCFRKNLGIASFEFPSPTNEPVKLSDVLLPDGETKRYVINGRNDVRLIRKEAQSNLFGEYPLKPIRVGVIGNGGQGERVYNPLGHAITLSAYGGGVASKTGAYLINGKVRKLAPRECARVMGFPDDFKIPVNDAQAYKQFGNSVAVPVLKKIFEQVSRRLNEKQSDDYYQHKKTRRVMAEEEIAGVAS